MAPVAGMPPKSGDALRHKLGVGVVVVADDTVGYGCRQQRLDGTEHGDGHCRSHQTLYCLPCHHRYLHVGYGVAHVEAVADGLNACDACVLLQEQSCYGHNDDSYERAGYLLAELRCDGDDYHAHHAHQRAPKVGGGEVLYVANPLLDEIGRHRVDGQSEEVLNLCGEDGYGDTACETYNNRVGDVFDDSSEFQQSE